MSTTYIAQVNGQIDTRTSAASSTMNYSHAVWVDATAAGADYTPGVRSWHNTEAAARKAADSYRKDAKGATYTVVPVEARQGGKAKVLRELAAEQATRDEAFAAVAQDAAEQLAEAKPAKAKKATAKKAEKATPAKAEKVTRTPEELAQARNAQGLAKAKANLAEAQAQTDGMVNPGLVWRVRMFEKGLTQAETADRMGVAGMTLNRILNGQGIPTAALTVKFARATGLGAVELWSEVADYELNLALAADKA